MYKQHIFSHVRTEKTRLVRGMYINLLDFYFENPPENHHQVIGILLVR